ncbi:uncharacterized protein LOC122679464 isoform X2 [Cervus elaphus]|uniref:uncharacterized protein LOC122679464 isoform X2 n=1 Tax=Cervus elaphus TaxID=9860 RepID=UPI001CC27D0A|nr:uncharacterized protein LOC122679464 isoform X2 [Cervus elaphus]
MNAGPSGGPRGGWVPALSAAGAPASSAFRCGIRKGAHSPFAGSAAAASPHRAARPRALSQARRRRGGRDWAREAAGRDLEKPPRLHCSGRGRWRSRFRRAACPRGVLRARFPGARPCGARGLVRGPRAAAAGGGEQPVLPTHTHTGRETVAEKVLQLLKESCPARPLRPLLSGSEEIDSEDLERS